MSTPSLSILCETPELQFVDQHSTFTVCANPGLLVLSRVLSVTVNKVLTMSKQTMKAAES